MAASAIAGQAAAIMIGAASRPAVSDLLLRKFLMVRTGSQNPSAGPRQGGRSARLIAGASRGQCVGRHGCAVERFHVRHGVAIVVAGAVEDIEKALPVLKHIV